MANLTHLAVPDTMELLTPALPAAPARICEVGCGRGALAAALGEAGYRVVGLEPNPESAEQARARGVDVRAEALADHNPPEPYDVVLFTRSLHHIADLAGSLDHARKILTPDGVLIAEEFARERADYAAAAFLLDTIAVLVAAGLAERHDDEEPGAESIDPLTRWHERFHGHHHDDAAPAPEHDVADIVRALSNDWTLTTTDTPGLWRMVAFALADTPAAPDIAMSVRALERRRIADRTLPALGALITARRADRAR